MEDLIISRIADLFKSEDRELNRLGQKYCSIYRLSYYIIVNIRPYVRSVPIFFSLTSPTLRESSYHGENVYTVEHQHPYLRIFKIELNEKRTKT